MRKMEPRTKKERILLAIALLMLASMPFVMADTAVVPSYQYSPFSYYGASAAYFFPTIDQQTCDKGEGQDFVLNILPGSCTPAVVRSDLLEEQPVPVFCRLTATKVNPLIEIPRIKSVNFASGSQTPKGIKAILFHPYRAALRKLTPFDELVGSPIGGDLGYVVVVLNQIPSERDMPDSIRANLTARIEYDVTTTFGITNDNFILPVIKEEDWDEEYKKYGFWNGKGYVRAINIGEKTAQITVYAGPEKTLQTFTLEEGKRSPLIYLPGMYCGAGLEVQLNKIDFPKDKATLEINGDSIEVSEGMTIMQNRCTVTEVAPSAYGVGGRVVLRCPEGLYTLNKPGATATIKIDGGDSKEVKTGDGIVAGGNNYTIAFAGKYFIPKKTFDDEWKIVVLSNLRDPKVILEANKRISNFLSSPSLLSSASSPESLARALDGLASGAGLKTIIDSGKFGDSEMVIEAVDAISQQSYQDVVEKYNLLYKESYETVVKDFPSEKDIDSPQGEFYGERALWQAQQVAERLKKNQDQARILEDFISRYPQSTKIAKARSKLATIYSTGSSEDSTKIIVTGGKTYYVGLESSSSPTTDDLGVKIFVNNELQTLGLKSLIGTDWQVEKINPNSIEVKRVSDVKPTEKLQRAGSITLTRGQNDRLGDNLDVRVDSINIQRQAVVSVHPYSRAGETFANFSVNIGIEKRAIKLSVEQTKSLIGQLDDTISQFEEVTKKLGEIVTTWKKVCLAGSAAIWTLNFFENFASGGEAAARQKVMREIPLTGAKGGVYRGWTEWCNEVSNQQSIGSEDFNECIFKSRDEISKEINVGSDVIEGWNDLRDNVDKSASEQSCILGLFACKERITDEGRQKIVDKLGSETFSKYGLTGVTGVDEFGQEAKLSSSQINSIVGKFSPLYRNRSVSFEETKDLNFEAQIVKKCQEGKELTKGSAFCTGMERKLYDRLHSYDRLHEDVLNRNKATNLVSGIFEGLKSPLPSVTEDKPTDAIVAQVKAITKNEVILNQLQKDFEIGREDTIAIAYYSLKKEFAGVPETFSATGAFGVKVVRDAGDFYVPAADRNYFQIVEGKLVPASDEQKRVLRDKITRFAGKRLCSNTNANPEIVFWGSGPFAGLPAIVPIEVGVPDGSHGWYAATRPYGDSLRLGLTNVDAYTEAGEPTHFWLANVGPDNRVNFVESPSGDDSSCAQYFALTETYQGTSGLGAMNPVQTAELVKKAAVCIKEAASQSKGAQVGQTISTQCGAFKVGQAKAATPASTCEDLMSPERCNLLYNLCDPVICPPSRCDLGGRYPTDNVVQSGIIGSLALCLPNGGVPGVLGGESGGVAVPVCLTGVHAGLDNLVSVLKDTRRCLQESLDTGRNVGICDELKSVYMCEFFWRELTPFLKVGIPNLVESAINKRGGGEYMTFATAYDTSVKQVEYFTTYYGANALRAFQVRSTAEAGSFLCKAFVGLRYPDSANLFDELARPESPVQVNAWFNDIPFSSATVPQTSQYKVFWHIFAGRDEPAYWTVYLKNPAFVPTVNIPEQYVIQSGYTSRGESTDITRDVLLPSGYKELCVRVNLKDYCGFKKATTGFATTYLTDQYIASQTVPDYEILTEDECTSGKSTLLATESLPSSLLAAVAQPGIGGIGEAVQPQIYRRGIVRICSGDNPGLNDAPSRWSKVGFCNVDARIGCWLDRNSVANAIIDLNLTQVVLDDARNLSNSLLGQEGKLKTEEVSRTFYNSPETKKSLDKLIEDLKKVVKEGIASGKTSATIDGDIENTLKSSGMLAQYKEHAEFGLSKKYQALSQLKISEIYKVIVLELRLLPAPAEEISVQTATRIKSSCESLDKDYGQFIRDAMTANKAQESYGGYDTYNLIKALILRESGGRPNPPTVAGAIGLMQVLPSTAVSALRLQNIAPLSESRLKSVGRKTYEQEIFDKLKRGGVDLSDVNTNLKAGIKEFMDKVSNYRSEDEPVKYALSAYLVGGGNLGGAIEFYKLDNWAEIEQKVRSLPPSQLQVQDRRLADSLGTSILSYTNDILRNYELCKGTEGEKEKELISRLQASSDVKVSFSYAPDRLESVDMIFTKVFGSLYPANQNYRDPNSAQGQRKMKEIMDANQLVSRNVPAGTVIQIPLDGVEYDHARLASNDVQTSCGECGEGRLLGCKRDACNSISVRFDASGKRIFSEVCTFTEGGLISLFGGECTSCASLYSCNDIKDADSCRSTACTSKLSGGKKECVVNGNLCLPKA